MENTRDQDSDSPHREDGFQRKEEEKEKISSSHKKAEKDGPSFFFTDFQEILNNFQDLLNRLPGGTVHVTLQRQPDSFTQETSESSSPDRDKNSTQVRFRDSKRSDKTGRSPLDKIREFNLKPREIKSYLDRYVIGQEDAKKVLSVAVCDHYNHVRYCLENPDIKNDDYTKPNILLLGPTGVGKTYLIRVISNLIGVPFVKADATKFSETGYVGRDVEDLIRDLYRLADGDVELAQFGIVYLDEIDKIASRRDDRGRDVSGRGVQINLLKLMEDTEVPLQSQTDLIGQMEVMMSMMNKGKKQPREIRTRHILFIVSGAFENLSEIIKRRMTGSNIGFYHQIKDNEGGDKFYYLSHAQTEDFIKFGLEPEFIGRLPIRVACHPLNAAHLRDILTSSEGSILKQYRRDFAGYGIELKVTPEAIDKIAQLAEKEGTGARGLVTILERILKDFKFDLPSTSVKSLIIDEETVLNPQKRLKQILAEEIQKQIDHIEDHLQRVIQKLFHEKEYKVEFSEEAIQAIKERVLATHTPVEEFCLELLKNYPYGLSIVTQNTHKNHFILPQEAILHPEEFISRYVRESFMS